VRSPLRTTAPPGEPPARPRTSRVRTRATATAAAALVVALGAGAVPAQAAAPGPKPSPAPGGAAAGTSTKDPSAGDRVAAQQAAAAAAAQGVAATPYLGWSSWSMQSSNYPGLNPGGNGSWLTEANLLPQVDALASKLKPYGYEYVNIDAGWSRATATPVRPSTVPRTHVSRAGTTRRLPETGRRLRSAKTT
jgi:hypothetical protein